MCTPTQRFQLKNRRNLIENSQSGRDRTATLLRNFSFKEQQLIKGEADTALGKKFFQVRKPKFPRVFSQISIKMYWEFLGIFWEDSGVIADYWERTSES